MLRVEEALQLFSSFYGEAASIEMLLERFGLAEKHRAFFETLSGGQKQRLALARFRGSRLFPLGSLRRGPRGRVAGEYPRISQTSLPPRTAASACSRRPGQRVWWCLPKSCLQRCHATAGAHLFGRHQTDAGRLHLREGGAFVLGSNRTDGVRDKVHGQRPP